MYGFVGYRQFPLCYMYLKKKTTCKSAGWRGSSAVIVLLPRTRALFPALPGWLSAPLAPVLVGMRPSPGLCKYCMHVVDTPMQSTHPYT